MDLGFRGEVADFYHRYRRGYPAQVIAALLDGLGLTGDDLVLDLGCGTGQLGRPLAGHVRAVLGVDPEPDMLARAREAADGIPNVNWLLGSDADLPALHRMLGDGALGAVTVGQALHWMDHDRVFRLAGSMLRPGGGVAVVTNGAPLWLRDNGWSAALREFLEGWWQRPLVGTCGTDDDSQRRYRDSMIAAGLTVTETAVEYPEELDLDQIVGNIYSASSPGQLPAVADRADFAARIGAAIAPYAPFTNRVEVLLLIGRV